MGILSSLSNVARRVPVPGGSITSLSPNSLMSSTGINSATSSIDQVIGPMVGYGNGAQTHTDVLHTGASSDVQGDHKLVGYNQGKANPAAGVPTIAGGGKGGKAVLRAGQSHAKWANLFLACGMPAVLQLNRLSQLKQLHLPQARTQMALEVRVFRERLAAEKMDWNMLTDASYLLCTFLDERANDIARESGAVVWGGERSLLVEYHGDAWGGEDTFADLQKWMEEDNPPRDLLIFYELILSLGCQGRYRVMDNGEVLLQDLRSRLHSIIWRHAVPEPLGTPLVVPSVPKRRWLTPLRAMSIVLGLGVGLWIAATIHLDATGRPLREALAAWTPPVRTIDIAETLPPPLPEILSEGWLTAYKHPQGWLLVFKSDGAFGVGRADVRPEFMPNIERLGLAMAPWPGDLEVIGHTDRQPIRASRFASNQALSEARANTVAEELRKTSLPNGVSAPPKVMNRVITSVGMGESEPLDPADNPAAYSKNRRVDVLWKVVPEGRKDRWNARGSIADAAPGEQVNEPQVQSPQRSVNQEVNRDNP